MPLNVNLAGIKGVIATALATVGLWGVTTIWLNIPAIYVVWLILGLVIAIV